MGGSRPCPLSRSRPEAVGIRQAVTLVPVLTEAVVEAVLEAVFWALCVAVYCFSAFARSVRKVSIGEVLLPLVEVAAELDGELDAWVALAPADPPSPSLSW